VVPPQDLVPYAQRVVRVMGAAALPVGIYGAMSVSVLSVPAVPLAPVTCVEDAGGQRCRYALVHEQLPQHHPDRIPGKPPLQEPHPEETEVPVESERDHGHVPRVSPVQFVRRPRQPLVDEVPAGEQAAVQRHVGGPREPADLS